MSEKLSSISISFDAIVNLPDGWERALDGLIGMICEQYQRDNPTRVMWPAGAGNQPILRSGEIVSFNTDVYSVECSEREDYYGNNPHNPNQIALREKAREERMARKKAAA